jgi:RNA polymerase sigma factor (sigma-70 family)
VIELEKEAWSAQLGAVLERVRPQLTRLFKAYRIPALDAQDLSQEALLVLIKKWPEIKEPCAYLVGATRHLCRSYVRQQLRQKARIALVDPERLEGLAGAALGCQEVRDGLADVELLSRALGPRPRRLLWMAYGLGMDTHEVAHALGDAKPASLGRASRRALTRLRELARRHARGW